MKETPFVKHPLRPPVEFEVVVRFVPCKPADTRILEKTKT